MDEAEALNAATKRYLQTQARHEDARQAAIAAVVAALRSGMRPTDVTARSPFTAAYVRSLGREHGIGPAAPGPKKRTAPPAT
jgi:hypothetical protein